MKDFTGRERLRDALHGTRSERYRYAVDRAMLRAKEFPTEAEYRIIARRAMRWFERLERLALAMRERQGQKV